MSNVELSSPREARLREAPVPTRLLAGLVALLLLLALTFAGCTDMGEALESSGDTEDSEVEKKEDGEEREEELPPVEVVSLERGEIEAVLRFSTNLEAESEVQVFSQAARLVTQLKVEEGDLVRAGQVLVRLQDEEQKSELARIESQLARARREYQRQESLFAQNLISEQVMNDATYEVEQLELALGDAQRNLGYTEVRAPISGTITGRHVNLGDHITVNQHLFDLVDFDSIVARVYVPEKELPRLRVGQAARLFSASIGDQARSGEVIRISPIVDPASGTVKVTVGIQTGVASVPLRGSVTSVPLRGNKGLLPGMYVEVELVTDTREDALLVPKRAVVYDQNQAFLYRLSDDMTAERLRIAVLLEDRQNVMPAVGDATPDSLATGDRIVVAGQAGLKDGAKVRLAGERAPTDAGGDGDGQAAGEAAGEGTGP